MIATTGAPDLISAKWVREGQIVLALSNPEPEIHPQPEVISSYAEPGSLVPSILCDEVHEAVADAVEAAAREAARA